MYSTTFHAGFADELTKTAGIRDVVTRLVHGKPIPKMGFFEKRRLAKVLGVKSQDVARTLLERQKKDRLTKGLVAGGGLTLGTVAGGSLSKEADDLQQSLAGAGAGAGAASPPPASTSKVLMQRRDALMKTRAGLAAPPSNAELMKRRDALVKSRPPAAPSTSQMMKHRDALMKSRPPTPAQPSAPLMAQR